MKTKLQRPRVILHPVAQSHALPNERIIEFAAGNNAVGGLISVKHLENGRVVVELYRLDEGVLILAPPKQTRRNDVAPELQRPL